MKCTCANLLVLALGLPILTQAATAQTDSPPQSFFIAKEKEDWEALKHKDKAAATRLLADNFVGTYDFGYLTKSEWIKQIDEEYMVEDYTIENAKLLRPSANTALLLYTSKCKGTGTWTQFCSHASRISDLYVERNGQWLALFSQDTQTTSGQTLAHDDVSGNSNLSGKDAVEGVPGPRADTTVVSLDPHAKFTPFEEMIIGREKEVLDLTTNGDYANWASLLSDDAVAVYDTGYASKAEVLKALKGMSGIHCSMDMVKVMPIGETAALILYRMTQDWQEQGKQRTRQYYISSLWVKRGGKWLSQFWQETDGALRDDDLSTQALTKEREILEAQNRNDWTAFANLLADDLVAIDEDGIHSKKEVLEQVRMAEVRFSDYKMENIKVIPQDNGATVAYKETLVGTEHGKPFTWHIYTHSHWERRGGKWLMTMFQDSTAKD
jgi:hypothetical protein